MTSQARSFRRRNVLKSVLGAGSGLAAASLASAGRGEVAIKHRPIAGGRFAALGEKRLSKNYDKNSAVNQDGAGTTE